MNPFTPASFALYALSASTLTLASPTGTIPSPITKTLNAREILVGQTPSSSVTLWTFTDTDCKQGEQSGALVYDVLAYPTFQSFMLTRDLLPLEQLDLNTFAPGTSDEAHACDKYLGSPISPMPPSNKLSIWSQVTGSETPAEGGACYHLRSGTGNCVKLWHH